MEKENLDYAGLTCSCFLHEEKRGNLALSEMLEELCL